MLGKIISMSLKTKIAGIVLLLFVASFWLLTYSVEKKLSQDMTSLLETQQFSTVSYVASDLDDKIRQRIELLEANAGIITPELLADPEKARDFLKSRFGLLALFKAGLSIISKDGNGITDYPIVAERANASFSEIEYFKEVLATGKTAIGKPRIGRFTKQPGVAFAAPIKDKSGHIIGLLVGFAWFSDSTLFGQVEHANVGKTGYITINVPKYGLIATSSNPSLILKPMAQSGVNNMLGRFLAGYEGSGIAVNSQWIETLTSAKQIPAAGWIAQIVLPAEEAFAPIRTMRFRAYSIAAALSAFVLVTVWLVIWRLLAPLSHASKSISEMISGDLQSLPVKYHDEIGFLLKNFNFLVSERKQTEEALRNSEDKFRNILENAPIGMAMVSIEGRFMLVNRSLCEIVGYTKEELENLTYQEITHPDDLESNFTNVQLLLDGRATSFHMEKRYIRKDKQVVWTQLTSSVVRNAAGTSLYLIAQIEDITNRKRNQEQIHRLAFYDALTNLPNRRLLLDRFNQALVQAKRFHRSLAIMYLDIDDFKRVNDTLGHDIGDELLKIVADRLQTCVRSMDTVCRQGGDEFIVVLSEISQMQDAAIVADKIIKVINKPVSIQEYDLRVTTSIGIAIYPVNGTDDARELMKKADMAMYEVKNKGKNGFTFYQ
ncbi:MAG: diguanylate cyclase [Steroidobacteraceae bacterium]|nr:diguanylate cyclase [Deltaproteobacteria bacterium]